MPGATGYLINDCFDWAVTPCLSNFERLSPPPPPLKKGAHLTLDHFLTTSTSFECDLITVDNTLSPGEIERLDDDTDDECPWPSSPNPQPPWTTTFPSFHPSEITVICDDDNPTPPFDTNPNPTHVLYNHHHLHFKESPDPDDITTQHEVATYEQIARANLSGANARTSRLYGVVRNAKSQLVGLLLHRIEEDAPLADAVGPETPRAVRERWARQVRETVAALHGVGVVWAREDGGLGG